MLLIDENLSYKIPNRIKLLFPDSKSVSLIDELGETTRDSKIWEYAKNHSLTIVTKDYDFIDISTSKGWPPKILLLQIGNMNLSNTVSFIQMNESKIKHFLNDNQNGLLTLNIRSN